MNKKLRIALLTVIALFLISSPWWIAMLYDVPGTDDKASDMIGAIKPGYTPWISNIGPGLSDRVEHIMLAVQIAVGLALFFYCMRLFKKYRKKQIHS